MTDSIHSSEFDAVVRSIIRDVLRAELIDYIPTLTINPSQIAGINDDGTTASVGDSLKIDTDGEVRFLP